MQKCKTSDGEKQSFSLFISRRRSLLEAFEGVPEPRYGGSEYRGTRSDGTLMRWVGVFGESISYDHASKGSAQSFDKIIDTLCWFEREF